MNIGNGSISLNVKNLETSIKFYQGLGFKQSGGNIEHRYVVMQNDTLTIGLYEAMLETNMLTFNPKWDRNCNQMSGDDVRAIHQYLTEQGFQPEPLGSEQQTGPNHFMVKDPDGNLILIDQHL